MILTYHLKNFNYSKAKSLLSSKKNIDFIKKYLGFQTIGHDKLNQLRHVKFFKDFNGIKEQMKKHAALLRPNFETVENALERDLGGLEIGSWDMPRGGYFIHFESLNGCANEIVKMDKMFKIRILPLPKGKR